MLQIRFHGRGGQGVVTAAHLLAEASGFQGLYTVAFPIYGAERRGAEIEAYCRISESPIRVTSSIEKPDISVILDNTLLSVSKNPLRGLEEGKSSVLINSKHTINLKYKVYYVDATGIALNIGLVKSGWPLVNVIMLGSLIRIINNMVSLESLKKAINEEFSGKVAELNIKGVELAYNNVREVMELVH